MAKNRIELKGLDRIMAKLNAVRPEVGEAVQAVALEVKGDLAKYPRQRKGGRMQFKSGKQRTFVLAAIKSGLIEVPYRRGASPGSETLSKRWTIQAKDDDLTAVVGNNSSYGPFVQDEKKQLPFHEITGWPTVQSVKKEWEPKFLDRVRKAVRGALNHGRTHGR